MRAISQRKGFPVNNNKRLLLQSALALAAAAAFSSGAMAQDKPIKVGVTGGPHAQIFEQVKKVAEKDGQCDEVNDGIREAELPCKKDRDCTLERVADQRHQCSFLVAATQYIRCARVARAVAAWVGQSKDFRGNHCKGNGAK